MKKKKSLIIASVILLLLPTIAPISAKKMRVQEHDGPHDWFTIYVGTPSIGYDWLDIIMTSIERDGDTLILSTTVRGRIPEHHPDGINAACARASEEEISKLRARKRVETRFNHT